MEGVLFKDCELKMKYAVTEVSEFLKFLAFSAMNSSISSIPYRILLGKKDYPEVLVLIE